MGQGWIKLHRQLMEGETFSKLTAIQKLIAIYIILNANHADGIWYDKYKNIQVPVKRGQLVVSRQKIKNEWFNGDKDITDRKIRTTLNKLNGEFLTMKTTNSYTLLTVLNYDVYQDYDTESDQQNDQDTTSKRPANDQETTTNKNDKNVKNEKKYIPLLYAESVKLTQEEYNKLVDAHGEEDTRELITILNNYKLSSGKRYKSDYRAILTWVVDKLQEKKQRRSPPKGRTPTGKGDRPMPRAFASLMECMEEE